jgi:hypothetical protein
MPRPNFLLHCSLILFSVFTSIPAAESTAEGANPFNKFKQPDNGVNISSGDATFSLPLYTLIGQANLNAEIALSYSSNVQLNVRARNDVAPTSWLGLGWSFGCGAVIAEQNNTAWDSNDRFYWISPEGVSYRLRCIDYYNKKYVLDRQPFYKVIVHRGRPMDALAGHEILGWTIIDTEGKSYIYGDLAIPSEQHATRYTLAWLATNYVGSGFGGTPTKLPCRWDLAQIKDVFGNNLNFYYDPTEEQLNGSSWNSGDVTFTKESYLRKIVNTRNDSVVIYTGAKSADEYMDPQTQKTEPDLFVDPYETKTIDSIRVFLNSKLYRRFEFCYQIINPVGKASYAKRLLTSILETNADREKIAATSFEYYDGIERTDDTFNPENPNYNLGAVRKMTAPTCGAVEYEYKYNSANATNLTETDHWPNDRVSSPGRLIAAGSVGNGNEYMLDNNGMRWTWGPFGWKKDACGSGLELGAGGKDYHIRTGDVSGDGVANFQVDFWDDRNKNWRKTVGDVTITAGSAILGMRLWPQQDGTVLGAAKTIQYSDGVRSKYYLYSIKVNTEKFEANLLAGINVDEVAKDCIAHGNNFVVFVVIDKGVTPLETKQEIQVHRWNGKAFIKTTLPLPNTLGSISAGDDYFVVHTTDGLAWQYDNITVYTWNGADWVLNNNEQNKRVYAARHMRVDPANNYFIIEHPKVSNISYYTWDGEKWSDGKTINSLGNKPVGVSLGNNLFAACYSQWISGKCSHRRDRSKISAWQFNGATWEKNYGGYLDFDAKENKNIGVGRDFILASVAKDKFRNPTSNFTVRTTSWNGSNWGKPEEEVNAIHGNNPAAIRFKPAEITTFGNAFYAFADGSTTGYFQGWDVCENWAFRTDDDYTGYARENGCVRAKKYKDSFKEKVGHFVVSRKLVYDGMVASQKNVPENVWDKPAQVIAYDFSIKAPDHKDGNIYFDTDAGCAFYPYTLVTVPGQGTTIYANYCTPDKWYLLGKTISVEKANTSGKGFARTDYTYAYAPGLDLAPEDPTPAVAVYPVVTATVEKVDYVTATTTIHSTASRAKKRQPIVPAPKESRKTPILATSPTMPI